MIIDLDEADAGEVIECDLCVAGAGAAGLSIALQFIDQQHLDVVVLEGGGRDFSDVSQELYQGRNLGFEYYDLDASRLRYLGGSTNHWGGWCRPLDPMDFEALASERAGEKIECRHVEMQRRVITQAVCMMDGIGLHR